MSLINSSSKAARLLLCSNSTMPNTEYMEWVTGLIKNFLKPFNVKEILFIPFAGVTITWDDYTVSVQKALADFTIVPIHKTVNFVDAVRSSKAIMIGGGNTFHLLYKLYEHKLLDEIRDHVLGPNNVPYIGWSAGSNVAGPDIGTTNDMPIIWPQSDKALGLVPYNLNPHYSQWKPAHHKGESRNDRLNECILVKKRPIVAIAEGVAIEVENGLHQLVAPPLSKNCFGPDGDKREVKIFYYHDNKPQIVDVPLDAELIKKISDL